MELQTYQNINNQQNLEMGLYTAAVDIYPGETHTFITGSISTAVAYCNKHYQQGEFDGCHVFSPAGKEIFSMSDELEIDLLDSSIIPILQVRFPIAFENINK